MSGTFDDLFAQVERGRPVVVGLAKPMALTGGRSLAHYEVVIGLNRSRRLILSLDPAEGLRENTLEGIRARMGSDTASDDRISRARRRGRRRRRRLRARPDRRRRAGGRSRSAPLTSPPRGRWRARRTASFWAPRRPRTRSRAARTTTGRTGRRAAIPTERRTSRAAPARPASPIRGTCGDRIWRPCSSSAPTRTAWASSGAGSSRRPACGTKPPPPATARCSRGCAPRGSRRS